MFLSYSALSVLLLQVGQHDPQIVREFQRSGITNLPTYIVGDYLAAMIAHLWIGLLTGVGFGMLGSGLGIGFAHTRKRHPTRPSSRRRCASARSSLF